MDWKKIILILAVLVLITAAGTMVVTGKNTKSVVMRTGTVYNLALVDPPTGYTTGECNMTAAVNNFYVPDVPVANLLVSSGIGSETGNKWIIYCMVRNGANYYDCWASYVMICPSM